MAAKTNDPAMEKVKLRLHRAPGVKKKGELVNVNNHRWFIPYGETVEVPRYIAEVVENATRQNEETAMRVERLAANLSDM